MYLGEIIFLYMYLLIYLRPLHIHLLNNLKLLWGHFVTWKSFSFKSPTQIRKLFGNKYSVMVLRKRNCWCIYLKEEIIIQYNASPCLFFFPLSYGRWLTEGEGGKLEKEDKKHIVGTILKSTIATINALPLQP